MSPPSPSLNSLLWSMAMLAAILTIYLSSISDGFGNDDDDEVEEEEEEACTPVVALALEAFFTPDAALLFM